MHIYIYYTFILYTLLKICTFYIILDYTYSEQGCHSDNCHLSIVLLYLFHYMMCVIIMKIKYHPLLLIIATDTRYFLWCPCILHVHVIIIISEDETSDKYHMFNLL